VDCVVGVGQSIVGTDVNRLRHLSRRRRDTSDVALRFERAHHLDTEVDIHRFMSMRRVMIEEQVVSGVQLAARLQERPYAIERRLPCSGDITEGIVARVAATSSGRTISTNTSRYLNPFKREQITDITIEVEPSISVCTLPFFPRHRDRARASSDLNGDARYPEPISAKEPSA
jgi:hypothetical protein